MKQTILEIPLTLKNSHVISQNVILKSNLLKEDETYLQKLTLPNAYFTERTVIYFLYTSTLFNVKVSYYIALSG